MENKNWVRFKITLESFYVLHGRWPSRISLYPLFIKELQDKRDELLEKMDNKSSDSLDISQVNKYVADTKELLSS